jgi:hypothetical protein
MAQQQQEQPYKQQVYDMMIEVLSNETQEYKIRAFEVIAEKSEADCSFLVKQGEAGLRVLFAGRMAGVAPGRSMRSTVCSCTPPNGRRCCAMHGQVQVIRDREGC